MKYRVFQFYRNLGMPVIIHEYDTKAEAYEDINICRNYANVPYLATDKKGKIFDICTFDMSREEMAKLLMEVE